LRIQNRRFLSETDNCQHILPLTCGDDITVRQHRDSKRWQIVAWYCVVHIADFEWLKIKKGCDLTVATL
jgi:hypothetical protein